MSFRGNGFNFETGTRTFIMGILNITPDSFYDGGKYTTVSAAVAHARELERDGADFIDIGANSTRPGANILSADAELLIIGKMLPEIAGAVNIPVSVDTFYPKVADFSLRNGAKIINDISGRINTEMLELIKKYNAGYIAMHNPLFSSSEVADYSDGGVVKSVEDFFESVENEAERLGLSNEQMLYDIGIGFSKSQADNFELIKKVSAFKKEGRSLLVALSNKRMTEVMPDMTKEERIYSTVAANTLAIAGGADFIRVHNVREAKIAVCATDRIAR